MKERGPNWFMRAWEGQTAKDSDLRLHLAAAIAIVSILASTPVPALLSLAEVMHHAKVYSHRENKMKPQKI